MNEPVGIINGCLKLTVSYTSVASQPSDTDVVIKLETYNLKGQRFHGIWQQWR